jgi:hypothetical protein
MVDSLFLSKVAQFLTTIIGSIYHDHLQRPSLGTNNAIDLAEFFAKNITE